MGSDQAGRIRPCHDFNGHSLERELAGDDEEHARLISQSYMMSMAVQRSQQDAPSHAPTIDTLSCILNTWKAISRIRVGNIHTNVAIMSPHSVN